MKRFGAALAALAVAVSGPAYAFQTGVRHYFTYYEGYVGGPIVGYTIYYCDDTVQYNGVITQYYDQDSYDC